MSLKRVIEDSGLNLDDLFNDRISCEHDGCKAEASWDVVSSCHCLIAELNCEEHFAQFCSQLSHLLFIDPLSMAVCAKCGFRRPLREAFTWRKL